MAQDNIALGGGKSATKLPFKFLAGFVVLYVLALVYMQKVVIYLLLSFITAFLLEPIVSRLERKRVPRSLGAGITIGLAFLFSALLMIVMLPVVIDQAQELVWSLPAAYQAAVDALSPFSIKYFGYNVFTDFGRFIRSLQASGGGSTELMQPLGNIVSQVFSNVFRFFFSVVGFMIVPLLTYWLLRELPTFHKERIESVIPEKYHKIAELLRLRINKTLGGFIRGQLIVSSILAVYYSTALSIVGVNLSLLLGILAGFLNVVPYIGIFSILTVSLLLALLHGGLKLLLIVLVTFIVGMVLEGSVITPKFMGREIGLSPLTLITALLVGGELFGLVGMVISVPTAAMMKVIIELTVRGYRSAHQKYGKEN